MYKMKYIFGQTIMHKGQRRKIIGIRFSLNGVMYKLSGIRDWINEKEV